MRNLKTIVCILAWAISSLLGWSREQVSFPLEEPLTTLQASTAPVFQVLPIDSTIYQRIYGKSYPQDCPIPLNQLRYLLITHIDSTGRTLVGELICNRLIAAKLVTIFRELWEKHYPIEHVGLIDDYSACDERSMEANNSSAFNYRKVAGSYKLSAHARGLAVDINPLYNPYVKMKNGKQIVMPKSGSKYANRALKFPYKIVKGDACYQAFIKQGFRWGGAWRSVKDYQHFEYSVK